MSTTSSPGATPSADEPLLPGAHRPTATPPSAGGWTSDAGLLVLRLVLAVSFIGHGAQKFGAFGGTGIDVFAAGTLTGYGFRFPLVLAYINGLTELAGGILVAVGLLTPLAATGLMAVMIDSTLLKFGNGFFFTNPGGYEIDVALGARGRDRAARRRAPRPRHTRPGDHPRNTTLDADGPRNHRRAGRVHLPALTTSTSPAIPNRAGPKVPRGQSPRRTVASL